MINCIHIYVKANGVNGGHVFHYCNKCGMTKHGIKKFNIAVKALKKIKRLRTSSFVPHDIAIVAIHKLKDKS